MLLILMAEGLLFSSFFDIVSKVRNLLVIASAFLGTLNCNAFFCLMFMFWPWITKADFILSLLWFGGMFVTLPVDDRLEKHLFDSILLKNLSLDSCLCMKTSYAGVEIVLRGYSLLLII